MPVEKPPRILKLRTHKATGQGYVVLNGQAIYLGRAGLPETERRYHQVIAEWLANNRQSRVAPDQLTVKELIARYWLHAEKYYRDSDGQVSRELENMRDSIRPVKEPFALTPAAKFGPRALRDNPRRQRINRLNWEVANRTKWDEDVALGSQHAAAVPLTELELAVRRAELRRLSSTSLPWRALQYLLNCWACQTFWTPVLIYAVTAGVTAPAAWLFSAAAYSGAAVVLSALLNVSGSAPAGPGVSRTGCKNCGK